MSRYGIAEWYGRRFLALTPEERKTFAETALREREVPQCPFRPMTCNKKGGVCSIQPYNESGGRIASTDGPPVIVCPIRFEQGSMVVRWLAEIVGFQPNEVKLAREVPFMAEFRDAEGRRQDRSCDCIRTRWPAMVRTGNTGGLFFRAGYECGVRGTAARRPRQATVPRLPPSARLAVIERKVPDAPAAGEGADLAPVAFQDRRGR